MWRDPWFKNWSGHGPKCRNHSVSLRHGQGAPALQLCRWGQPQRELRCEHALAGEPICAELHCRRDGSHAGIGGPHHWSCGFASFGIQNREAAIRICPSPARDPKRQASGFNLEYRPADATASAYMIIGALIQAGLSGVRRQLPLPPSCDVDPAELSEAQRRELGIVTLPASLTEALTALEADEIASSWMPPTMRRSYVDVKRLEQKLAEEKVPEEVCRQHAAVY